MRFKHWCEHQGIALLILVFWILGLTYGVVTPVFEAPDESEHYAYIQHLADGGGLPVQSPDRETAWKQEGSQPPLYYAAGAALTFWIETGSIERMGWRNPHAKVGIPGTEDNINVFIHTRDEDFPWHGVPLAVHILRLFSLALGSTTVLFTYLLAREIFPQRKYTALGAAMLLAFTPQFVFISSAVNNDNAVIALCTMGLWLLVRIWRHGPSWRRWIALGMLVGLAGLAKLSGLGLAILAILVTIALWRREGASVLSGAALAGLIALALAGWWYVRNFALYGDFTGLNVMLDVFGRRTALPRPDALWGEVRGLRMSYWALFGWFQILVDRWQYLAFDLLAIAAVAGLGLALARRPRQGMRGEVGITFSWMLIIGAGLIRWTMLVPASQGRLLYPAGAAIAILMYRGLEEWVSARYHRWLLVVLSAVLFFITAICPWAFIQPAYARPAILCPEDVPASVQHVGYTYNNAMCLLGYQIESSPLHPGDSLRITVYWQSLAPMSRDYSVFVHLFGHKRQPIGQHDSYPGRGTYPTSLWQPGDIVRDIYTVQISDEAITPSKVQVEIGLYDLETYSVLPVRDASGRPVSSPILATLKLIEKTPPIYHPAHATDVRLGDSIALVGYDLDRTVARAGETVPLTLYWRCLRPLEKDYTVFTHIEDDNGEVWGQHDSQPLGGEYPTSLWSPDEVVRDEYVIPLQSDAPAGIYYLRVGMYLLETGERLDITGADGSSLGDYIELAIVTVR
ncbi:MAG: glycosyltransferase family 39 protein [Chloroflexi bacterium]|nr:glycosyltransferase family 39 protein [Chloroflexota bacterium]